MAKSKLHGAIREAEALLRRHGVRAPDLVTAIHAVNPTDRDLRSADEREAYALKSKLQSKLILEYFDELAIDLDPNQPGVLSLRYRPHDRDACHAILSELEPEARNKVQYHLDTAEPRPLQARSVPAAPRRAAPKGSGLVQQGRDALAEYEFERAHEHFLSAFEAGEEGAALALLELLVEHQAAFADAVALGNRLDPAEATAPVAALLATAAAHLDDEASCRRWMRSGLTVQPLCLLVGHALKRGELAVATRLLAEAKELSPTAPEVLAAQSDVEQFKGKRRAPAEQELATLVSAGQFENAEKKAREILAQWPESSTARSVVREAEARALQSRVTSLVNDAHAAREGGDDERAITLWSQAAQLGAPELEPLIQAATHRLEATRRQLGREAALTRLREAVNEASLAAYLELGADDRQLVRWSIDEPALGWLEELGSRSERDRARDIAAVLALHAASGASTERREELLSPHEERLRRVQFGRDLLEELATHAAAAASREAQARLDEARAALDASDWARAARLAEAPAPADLKEQFRKIANTARGQLEAAARLRRFSELFDQGRWLDALALLNSAERDPAADHVPWREHRRNLTERLRTAFAVRTSESPGDTSAADFPTLRFVTEPSYALGPDGAHAYWVTPLEDQLFVRKISVSEQRVVQTVAMFLPQHLPFSNAFVEGHLLWVTSSEGGAIRLDTRTWDVLAWVPRPELLAGERLEEVITLPGDRFQWLFVHGGEGGSRLRIQDLERARLHRELATDGFWISLATTERGARMWVPGDKRAGQLFEPGGSLERTLPLGTQNVCRAPGGDGLLTVGMPRDVDEDPHGGALRVFHLPDAGGAPQEVDVLFDTVEDTTVFAVTSVEERASFVLYGDGEESWLVCYGFENGVLKRLWLVNCPQPCVLFQDLGARHCVLVAALESGLRCLRLTTAQPNLENPKASRFSAPRFSPTSMLCGGPPRRKDYFPLVRRLRNLPGPRRVEELERVCRSADADADDLVALARSLRLTGLPGEGRQVLDFIRAQFPESETAPLERAEFAFAEEDWIGALAALSGLEGVAHGEHLRAVALFHLGRLDEARQAFTRCQAQESACRVEGWPEWIDALQGAAAGPAAEFISRVTQAETAMNEKRPRAALDLLDVPEVWRAFDAQLGARLAIAAHDAWVVEGQVLSVRALLITAAFLDECSRRVAVEVPLGRFAMAPERLLDAEGRTRDWVLKLRLHGGTT